jgi:hypothetical protein
VTDSPQPSNLAELFTGWATSAGGSPLYEFLTKEVATDSDLLDLAAEIEHGPPPNVLFAAVHYLLKSEDELAGWYASLHPNPPAPDERAFDAFKHFALEHRDQILELGRTRFVQTNEPRRCAPLLPYLALEADRLGEPVHLVEIGASAGLNLCLDRFEYRYTSGTTLGHSSVVLSCDDRGLVPIPERPPFVQRRVGIDLHPVDVDDVDQLGWLDALVWPEHHERRRRLSAAIAVRRSEQVSMVKGDASKVLASVVRRLPTGGPALLWHSFTLNQLDETQRHALDQALTDIARSRSVVRIGFEYWNREDEWPEIRVGLASDSLKTVARAHPHGEWVEAV